MGLFITGLFLISVLLDRPAEKNVRVELPPNSWEVESFSWEIESFACSVVYLLLNFCLELLWLASMVLPC